MGWLKEMFGTDKPIIALLHLNAFPGDPLFKKGDSMKKTVEDARKDLKALQDGGVDGVLFSNEFSLPYQQKIDYVGPAAMARVIGELMDDIRLPFGIDCEADPMAAIDLAAAVEADFIRGLFTGVYAGDDGITMPDIAAILRRKKALGLDDLKMLYFINNESDEYVVERRLVDIANSTIFDCHPDAFLIMGQYAGQDADSGSITELREAIDVPVLCGTGCNVGNIKEKLDISDGATVGTTFKKDGKFENHIEYERVKELMDQVREYRESHEKLEI